MNFRTITTNTWQNCFPEGTDNIADTCSKTMIGVRNVRFSGKAEPHALDILNK